MNSWKRRIYQHSKRKHPQSNEKKKVNAYAGKISKIQGQVINTRFLPAEVLGKNNSELDYGSGGIKREDMQI